MIEKLNERALRLVCNDYESNYNDLLIKTGKKMLYVMRKNYLAEFVFKVLNNQAPPLEDTFFQRQVSPYNMRDDNKLVQPPFNTVQFGKRSIGYQGPSIWNTLPVAVKSSPDMIMFKTELRKSNCLDNCECGNCMSCLRNIL